MGKDFTWNFISKVTKPKIAGNWDPAAILPNEFLAAAFTLFEMISREQKTQIAGVNLVLNAEGFSFKHLRYILSCPCFHDIQVQILGIWESTK